MSFFVNNNISFEPKQLDVSYMGWFKAATVVLLIYFSIASIVIVVVYMGMVTMERKKKIVMELYKESIPIDMVMVSNTVFDDATGEELEPLKKALCTICFENENTILMRPCNHTGFCVKCMVRYLNDDDACPLCKK